MKGGKIEVTPGMLETALRRCAKGWGPPLDGVEGICDDCYLIQNNLVSNGHMSTGETCFKYLAMDVIDCIHRLNDFQNSQCAKLLEKMEQIKIENAQLHNVIEQMDPDFFKRKCRVCGCDWNHPCNDHDFWVGDDLCSVCAEQGLGG